MKILPLLGLLGNTFFFFSDGSLNHQHASIKETTWKTVVAVNFHQLETPKTQQSSCLQKMIHPCFPGRMSQKPCPMAGSFFFWKWTVSTVIPITWIYPSQGSQANGPIMSIWWKPGKNKGVRPTMQRVQVHQILERSGPVPKTATKVTIPKKQGPVMVTLRLLRPEFYRRLFVPEAEKESPTTIISRWARLAQCSVSTLTGGRWERVIHKHGSFLIAHLRVSKDLASRIISHSGTDGLFATQVPSRDFPQDPVAWVPRKQAMSGEDYFKFVQGLSKSKGLFLLPLGKGGKLI